MVKQNKAKRESVRIMRTVLYLYGVLVDSKRGVLFEYELAPFILSWKLPET